MDARYAAGQEQHPEGRPNEAAGPIQRSGAALRWQRGHCQGQSDTKKGQFPSNLGLNPPDHACSFPVAVGHGSIAAIDCVGLH